MALYAFAAVVVAIVVLSILPGKDSVPVGHFDKLAHFAAYAAAGLTGMAAFGRLSRVWLLFAALMALGGGLEGAQIFVPGRQAGWGDFIANVAGAGFGEMAIVMAWNLRSSARVRSGTVRR